MISVFSPLMRMPRIDIDLKISSFFVKVPVLSLKMWLIVPSSSGSCKLWTLQRRRPSSDCRGSTHISSTSCWMSLETIILPISVLTITSRGISRTSSKKLVRNTKPILYDLEALLMSWYAYIVVSFMWVPRNQNSRRVNKTESSAI